MSPFFKEDTNLVILFFYAYMRDFLILVKLNLFASPVRFARVRFYNKSISNIYRFRNKFGMTKDYCYRLIPVHLNCRKICDSWFFQKFFFSKNSIDVLANCFYISSKKRCNLLAIQSISSRNVFTLSQWHQSLSSNDRFQIRRQWSFDSVKYRQTLIYGLFCL